MKNVLTVEQGLEAIMNIIEGGAPVAKAEPKKEAVKTVIYEHGRAIEVDGKKTVVGNKKRRTANRETTAKDKEKAGIMEEAMAVIARVKGLQHKVYMTKADGIVVRMEDADYSVKVTGHVKPEFAYREKGFKPEKNFMTRGKAVNHAPIIAKALVAEFENENPNPFFKNGGLLEAKASGVRFEIEDREFTLKIVKKRARLVIEEKDQVLYA